MPYIENLDDAKSEIARLLVQCDAKQNVIDSHRAFRADVATALEELRASIETRELRKPDRPEHSTALAWVTEELGETITALGLKEKE